MLESRMPGPCGAELVLGYVTGDTMETIADIIDCTRELTKVPNLRKPET